MLEMVMFGVGIGSAGPCVIISDVRMVKVRNLRYVMCKHWSIVTWIFQVGASSLPGF